MSGHVRWRAAGPVVAAAVLVAGCGSASPTAPVATAGTGSSGPQATSSPAGPSGSSDAGAASSTPPGAGTTSAAAGVSPSHGAASAQAVARAYFGAVASHDAGTARRYLAPEYVSAVGGASAFATWVANYRSLSHLAVLPTRPAAPDAAEQHSGYRDATLVPVSYTASVRTPSANETDGQLDRFVLVGRSASSGSWLILDITTSP